MTKSNPYPIDQLVDRLTRFIFVTSLLGILAIVLFPYDFFFRPAFTELFNRFLSLWVEVPYWTDLSLNTLLFMPLGFGLSCLLKKRQVTGKSIVVTSAITGFAFSFTLEIVQLFLPSRIPSIFDILTNGLGAWIGALCFKYWGLQILSALNLSLEKLQKWFSQKKVILLFGIYLTLTLPFSGYLQLATKPAAKLTDWETNFPLVVGNESDRNRPWNGTIYEFSVADRALSSGELQRVFTNKILCVQKAKDLLAFYCFINGQPVYDRLNNLPDFGWQGNPDQVAGGRGVLVNKNRWLKTIEPAPELATRISSTGEFTILCNIATNDIDQSGPARIISYSKDAYHRNFMLGQKGPDLVFRLRTQLSGENGSHPQFVAHNVLSDKSLHQIVVTYKDNLLNLYVDGAQYPRPMKITPGALLFSYMRSIEFFDMRGYDMVFYA